MRFYIDFKFSGSIPASSDFYKSSYVNKSNTKVPIVLLEKELTDIYFWILMNAKNPTTVLMRQHAFTFLGATIAHVQKDMAEMMQS